MWFIWRNLFPDFGSQVNSLTNVVLELGEMDLFFLWNTEEKFALEEIYCFYANQLVVISENLAWSEKT